MATDIPNLPTPGTSITSTVTLNTYEMGERIGEGAFGVVFECTDVWKNSLVAKVLKPHEALTDSLEKNAVDEINKLVHVRHPNITHIFDAFVFNGAYYIISERCDFTLAEMIKEENFDGRFWIIPIARCLLQAVHFTHVQHLVHCDIHPGNVFIRLIPDEMVPDQSTATTFKLGDFGIARQTSSLDPHGTFMNSIRPPEAIKPDEFGPLDHRLDLYQTGLLLLQLLVGRRNFSRDEILAGVPRELALALDAPYSFALEKALRRRVPYRTSSALELWRDLNSQASSDLD